jgi:uncharacterized protein (TIGR02266 family)
MLVRLRLHDLDEFMRVYSSDVSVGGMFIRGLEPPPVGTTVYLQFRLDDGSRLIEGLARVVHVNPPDHPAPGMGVEFVDLDPDSRRLIEDILTQRAGELEG